jgi:anaerobic selenocysteine-containing dehydrogenase
MEQTDLFKPYGHQHLQYSTQAIAPMGECKSNWTVQRLLAAAMGYAEPWLHAEPEEIIREVLDATRAKNPRLTGITLERLQAEGTVPYHFGDEAETVPFADGRFPTPSGKVELRSSKMEALGLDPLPDHVVPDEFRVGESGSRDVGKGGSSSAPRPPDFPTPRLVLITGAAHHFVSGSFANQPTLFRKEGTPFVEIHPADAAERGVAHGDEVVLENARGSCRLRAVVTEDVQPGVLAAPKGYWGQLSPDGRNVNWLTSDALADLAGQATFHSNLVELRLATAADRAVTAAAD